MKCEATRVSLGSKYLLTPTSLLAKGQPAKKLIRELIQEEADGKSHKSNADTKQCTKNEDVSVRRCLKICL